MLFDLKLMLWCFII